MEKLTSIQQINSAIMFGTWTDVELRSMADAIRFNQTSLRKQVKRNLDVGVRCVGSVPRTPQVPQAQLKRLLLNMSQSAMTETAACGRSLPTC